MDFYFQLMPNIQKTTMVKDVGSAFVLRSDACLIPHIYLLIVSLVRSLQLQRVVSGLNILTKEEIEQTHIKLEP